jgi:hypothetical protein
LSWFQPLDVNFAIVAVDHFIQDLGVVLDVIKRP